MDTSEQDDTVNLISHGLFMILKRLLGSEEIVKLRREMYEIKDLTSNYPAPFLRNASGSRAEGLSMKSSDMDWMVWNRHVSFVETYGQLHSIYSTFDAILLMDTSITSPGFGLLKIGKISQTFPDISYSVVNLYNDRYLNSTKYTQYWQEISRYNIHGPCVSGTFDGGEFDFAFCLHSSFWPRQAAGCIHRLHACGWPSHDTIKQILNNGCNVVPIASKTPPCREVTDMEWRISFSLAEKSLIHAMNHHQFLCYGLLKTFLNEVLKKN